jgi:TP53 regulating kinase-like protein
MKDPKIIQRGAEALILLEDNQIIKKRIKKSYRLPEIDERIRKSRTRSEGKLLNKAAKIIDIPDIISVDEKSKRITMEFLEGKKLSDHLDKFSLKKQKGICGLTGKNIAKLHEADLIHGDLTTSNMIFIEKEKKVYFRSNSWRFNNEQYDFYRKREKSLFYRLWSWFS